METVIESISAAINEHKMELEKLQRALHIMENGTPPPSGNHLSLTQLADVSKKASKKYILREQPAGSYYDKSTVYDSILAVMGDGGKWTSKGLVTATGKLEGSITKTLGILKKQKKIKRVSRGLYKLTGK